MVINTHFLYLAAHRFRSLRLAGQRDVKSLATAGLLVLQRPFHGVANVGGAQPRVGGCGAHCKSMNFFANNVVKLSLFLGCSY